MPFLPSRCFNDSLLFIIIRKFLKLLLRKFLNSRIYKTISDSAIRSGPTFQQLFNWAYDYRLKAMRRGESTPILDFFVYRKMRKMLGGKVRLMFSGGAPLSPETNDFIRVCMGAPLLQGYGLTETSACATLTEIDMVFQVKFNSLLSI